MAIPTAHIEIERWQGVVTRYLALPAVDQTQATIRNFSSSRANHEGDIQKSDIGSAAGTTVSSAIDNYYIGLMRDPNSAYSSAAVVIFEAEYVAHGPATTSVQDRADSLFNVIQAESSRYYVGSLPMVTWLARIAASTSLVM